MKHASNYCYAILLIWMSFTYGLGNDKVSTINNQQLKSNFNFNKLYAKNYHSKLDENLVYDPQFIKQQCPTIANQIISDVPESQQLRLEPSDCNPGADKIGDMHSLLLNSCNPANHGSFGQQISDSVVSISITDKNNMSSECSGTVINQNFILSAAHCFIDLYSNKFNVSTVLINKKYKIKTIYIPHNYDGLDKQQNDIALLELQESLPSSYKPVELADEVPAIPPSTSQFPELWIAGFGDSSNLSYRKHYLVANEYGAEWPHSGNESSDLNELYVSGTIPTPYGTESKPIGWRFIVRGDSGGPALLYNQSKKKFTLLGVNSYVFNKCGDYSFLAYLPYNLAALTSVPKYLGFIHGVTHHIIDPDSVRSITISPDKQLSLYVLSNSQNGFVNYYINDTTGAISSPETITSTGTFPTAMASDNYYTFISNFVSNNISRYKLGDDKKMHMISPPFTLPPGSGPTDIKILEKYLLVAGYSINKLFIYKMKDDGEIDAGIITEATTGGKPVSIATSTIANKDYIFVINESGTITTISAYGFNPFSAVITSIIPNMQLDKTFGQPLQILANDRYVFVRTTSGIYAYLFDRAKLILKGHQDLPSELLRQNDMTILPGIKLPYGLLAVSNIKADTQIYQLHINTDNSINFKLVKTLPIKAAGLSAYLDFNSQIIMYAANAAASGQNTLSIIGIASEDVDKESLRAEEYRKLPTIRNPGKVLVQALY